MITRRSFCKTAAAGILFSSLRANSEEMFAVQNRATEWAYSSGKHYADPFNEVDLDVVFTTPAGAEQRMPAYWSGENVWRVRYAPPLPGKYTYRTVCSDASNRDLHNRTGTLLAEPYSGDNSLYRHGMLGIAPDHRHFAHADGTPFSGWAIRGGWALCQG